MSPQMPDIEFSHMYHNKHAFLCFIHCFKLQLGSIEPCLKLSVQHQAGPAAAAHAYA